MQRPAHFARHAKCALRALWMNSDRIVRPLTQPRSSLFAVVEGVPEKAQEAARFLANYGEDLVVARRLIDSCLGLASDQDAPTSLTKDDIRAFRVSSPYVRESGFAWLDLALAYSSCGQYSKAEKALTVARGLAGATNRLILRAEARLYQHMRDPERALATLRRDPDHLLADPWLLAPEIGLSQLVGKHSHFVRRALAMVEHGDQPPFQVSELAAAVATAELVAGKHRLARKLFQLAVADPAELSLAQTVWAAQEIDRVSRKRCGPRKKSIDSSECRALTR